MANGNVSRIRCCNLPLVLFNVYASGVFKIITCILYLEIAKIKIIY